MASVIILELTATFNVRLPVTLVDNRRTCVQSILMGGFFLDLPMLQSDVGGVKFLGEIRVSSAKP